MNLRPRLRVAIFGDTYLPYLSGVTIATETLARGLAAAGHEVLLLVPAPAESAATMADLQEGHVAVSLLPSAQLPRPAPPGYRVPLPIPSAALRAATAFRPDVVHAQSPFVSGLMARRVARAVAAPLVFTHHTRFDDYGHYLGPVARPGAALVAAYLRAFWNGCAAVIAPGSDLAREIDRRLGSRRRPVVRAIPTGVDVGGIGALEPDDPRGRHGWPRDAIVVASLGRLAPEKSPAVLLEAFAAGAASDGRARLLFVGGGPLEEQLGARAMELGLLGRVAITGMQPRAAALAMLRACDLFATASRTETQGLVVAEALAAGLPAVALDAPGIRDAVRDGMDGVLVGSGAAGLAAAIAQLVADGERRRRMANAARDGSPRFDIGVQVEAVVRLYGELLAG